ncbi:cytidine deaminase-like protein [Rhodotorula diobovata]|uniref:Deoxycytidylate deaminase n=1 Tax=Rhodotorula diobovata TaxID=5288 RepID=A0A5C5FYY4_9BASI|nr:cytidine deaminase-like protein [Rhodotorula diobovata]
MLICLVGPPQAGKDSLARFLTTHHGFTRVHLSPSSSSSAESLSFSSSSDFLDHATRTWRIDYVTTDLASKQKLQEFAKRPFVAIVAVDAPLGVRFNRAVRRRVTGSRSLVCLPRSTTTAPTAPASLPASAPGALPAPPPPDSTLSSILPLASLTLPNPHASLSPFLSSFSLAHLREALRPSWDTYFMLLASLASLRSNCMKRRVGAVLVRDRRVVSTGYNGTPRGVRNCGEGGCARCNSHGDGLGGGGGGGAALDECLCLHAEENALLEAGRERVSGGGTEGAVLYCNTCPCLRCTVKIVQCGVKEVIYSLSYSMDAASRRVMEEAGVVLRQMPQPPFPR